MAEITLFFKPEREAREGMVVVAFDMQFLNSNKIKGK